MSEKKFKELDHCEKHDRYYHWKAGCVYCKRDREPKRIKKLDKVIAEMQESGMLPKVGKNVVKNSNTNN